MFILAVGAALARGGHGLTAFGVFCIGLTVAGIASSLIGLVQVFAPDVPDGDWIAISAIPGRATGNVRQPNHLSSLLLWSIVAVVWLGESKLVWREIVGMLGLLFVYVVFLSGSRTGALGMLTLAGWGLLDRRLSRGAKVMLILAPVVYGLCWWATSVSGLGEGQALGGQGRFGGSDISSARFAIWSNTLSLIAAHPWLGVGFGEFNFAWTLTPFPGRPTQLYDHSHNLVLNFMAELGIPLALVVLGLMTFALWKALQNAVADGRDATAASGPPFQRAAFVIVFLVTVHSMLEYPLWYAYYLLPTAFAFGLCLERPDAKAIAAAAAARNEPNVTRPLVIASMGLVLCGSLALYDYLRVVVIFVPPADAGPLEQRIADGRRSVLFGHHADYAAATIAAHPGDVIDAFKRAPHFLLDGRLMMAWATALAERGEVDKARYVAARLKEFNNEAAAPFFAVCDDALAAERQAAAASAPPPPVPFQCKPPSRPLTFEDFR